MMKPKTSPCSLLIEVDWSVLRLLLFAPLLVSSDAYVFLDDNKLCNKIKIETIPYPPSVSLLSAGEAAISEAGRFSP